MGYWGRCELLLYEQVLMCGAFVPLSWGWKLEVWDGPGRARLGPDPGCLSG